MALLHLLREAGLQSLVVCHLNHRLRGRAAHQDEAFVRKHCTQLGLTCHTQRVDVTQQAKSSGTSIETAARLARHQFFADCAKLERCSQVMLAHHADDQVETMLWNLLRGSHGWKGMHAIQTLRAGAKTLTLHRPLLSLRRNDLRDFLASREIPWREDATNAEPIATRNRLRLEVLPLLADVAQRDVVPSILRQIDGQDEQNEVLAWALSQSHAYDPQGRLHRDALRALPAAMQLLVLRDYLEKHQVAGINRELLLACRALIDHDAASRVNLPGARFFVRRGGRLFLQEP